eukprot:COSAG03_NODE_12188_length_557_cov_2.805677_2_plen_46_part_01
MWAVLTYSTHSVVYIRRLGAGRAGGLAQERAGSGASRGAGVMSAVS